jgi:hypothetical protein
MVLEGGFSIGKEIHRTIHNNEAELILEYHQKDRPDEKNFVGIYGDKEIQDDMDDLERMKERFSTDMHHLSSQEKTKIEEGKKRSEALEATIVGLADFGWFGSDTQTSRTHEHDDVFQGIDAILEIPRQKKDRKLESPKRLALAVDASTDQRTEIIREKIIRNSKKVFGTHRRPPKLKYFESKIQKVKSSDGKKVPYRGSLDFVVPVVVGLESSEANNLMSLYVRFLKLNQVENKNSEQKKDLTAVRAEILRHPAQAIFLKQITDQLNMYLNLAESADKKLPTKVVEQINELRTTFADFSIEKINDGIELGKLATDPVYKEIERISRELTPENIGLTKITTSP